MSHVDKIHEESQQIRKGTKPNFVVMMDSPTGGSVGMLLLTAETAVAHHHFLWAKGVYNTIIPLDQYDWDENELSLKIYDTKDKEAEEHIKMRLAPPSSEVN